MPVFTSPGQSTLTPTPVPCSSRKRVSASATTPCLVTQYGPRVGTAMIPAPDAV